MSTVYLAWLVTRDDIRFKRWPLVREACRVLRGRFENYDALLAELEVKAQPPEYWKKEQPAERAKEKAEKLRQLEERRAIEKQQRLEELRVLNRQRQAEQLQIVDASDYVRAARQKTAEQLSDDCGDLV